MEQIWITRQQVNCPNFLDATGSRERNLYVVFEPILWKKSIKEMNVVYEHLASRMVAQNELDSPPIMPTCSVETICK